MDQLWVGLGLGAFFFLTFAGLALVIHTLDKISRK